jgi:hypothetical protein
MASSAADAAAAAAGGAAADGAAGSASSEKVKAPTLATVEKVFCIRNGTERHEVT